jgi:DinB superfamily
MTDMLRLQDYQAHYVGALLEGTARAIEDLTEEQLHFRPDGPCNSIGFDAWHIGRTADNLIHFAFAREMPVWLQQGLNEAWGLPKADQGTGMTPEEAYALRFPSAELLAKYVRDVSAAVVPKIAAFSDDYLTERMDIKPNGNLARLEIIGQVIINHGNNHLGMINTSLTQAGLTGLGL